MQSTMNNIKNLVEVNNIVGEPIVTPDGQTIIPVSKLSFGFGGAGGDSLGGSKQGYGGGSAAAVKIEPIGFLVVKDDGVPPLLSMSWCRLPRVLWLAPGK